MVLEFNWLSMFNNCIILLLFEKTGSEQRLSESGQIISSCYKSHLAVAMLKSSDKGNGLK